MLHPSYTDLMKVVNKDVEEGETKVVNSRYSIVMATSKRARQIIGNDLPMVSVKNGDKPLSIAIRELNEGKLKILAETAEKSGQEAAEEGTAAALPDADSGTDMAAGTAEAEEQSGQAETAADDMPGGAAAREISDPAETAAEDTTGGTAGAAEGTSGGAADEARAGADPGEAEE